VEYAKYIYASDEAGVGSSNSNLQDYDLAGNSARYGDDGGRRRISTALSAPIFHVNR
jgi:hypothetical protein